MRAHAVTVIQIGKRIPTGIGFPNDLLEILCKLLATRVDKQASLASLVQQHGIDTIDSIFHRWVSGWQVKNRPIQIGVATEEVSHNLPIGPRRRRLAVFGCGVAIDMDFERPAAFPLSRTNEKLLTCRAGVRVG